MAGTVTRADKVATVFGGYSNAAVSAAQFLAETVVLFRCRVTAVKAYAEVAGSGAGSTVLDLLRNGTSIWTSAGSRPTLAATSTGELTNTPPSTPVCQPGDRLAWQVASVSSTGHARLFAAAALEGVA